MATVVVYTEVVALRSDVVCPQCSGGVLFNRDSVIGGWYRMNAYHLQRDGVIWKLFVTGGNAILQSDDRELLVHLARRPLSNEAYSFLFTTRRSDSKSCNTFVDGVENVHRESLPRLSADRGSA